jgi:AbrB family looped-hinge helix DNA binding protein
MQLTLLSSKGQVIIPKALRDARQWHAGTRLEVIDTAEGVLLRPVTAREAKALSQGLAAIRARMAYQGPAISLEETKSAVLQEAKDRHPG